jgi:mannose-1-phosphate guanylyltransferase
MARVVALIPHRIALLGIRPTFADTSLGYLLPGDSLRLGLERRAFGVRAFREKPSIAEARRLLDCGALWSSFVMVFRVSRALGTDSPRCPTAGAARA